MFTKKLVTKDNLETAYALFREIFPAEKIEASQNCFALSCQSEQKELLRYYIHYDSDVNRPMGFIVGMSGIYTELSEPECAWLGWFGVKEEFRRQRYGTRIINSFFDEARSLGFKYARLYTNADNYTAHKFYEFSGFKKENSNHRLKDTDNKDVVVFSRSLYPDIQCPTCDDGPFKYLII